MGAPVVEILSADKVFPNGTRALAPIDLTIGTGEFLTLIGPSGCGKSTLLKLIANLIEPTDGRLLWWSGAFDKTGASGRSLAFVFQDPTLMPWARVEANVRLPLDLAGVAAADSRPRVEDALARVGLEGFARHYPRQLSGGMKMRVSIARSLVTEPDLLLMDEPFSRLDAQTRGAMHRELLRIHAMRRMSILIVTHDVEEAVVLADHVVMLSPRPGRVSRWVDVTLPQPRVGTEPANHLVASLRQTLETDAMETA
jgi:NitT/TauT family transport system ATP-binding protein